jgi:phenylacetate-CoA ligase
MNNTLLSLYHHLPSPLRSAAASARGLYLRRWRFGPHSDSLIEQAIEREHWSEQQWQDWRQQRLAFILHRAATQVPYYREQWRERRRRGDRASWDYLENWPLLDKEAVRSQPAAFLAEDCDPRRMFQVQTSGTTGKPLTLRRSRATLRALYALSVARSLGWHGLSRRDRWARLGGQLVTPVAQRQPPFWVWNAALNQLYLSVYHLSPDLIPHYLEALAQYRISYLFGYTSAIHALAQEALRLGRRDLQLKVAITYGEPLPDPQRQAIAEAFRCPARETYGMGETVAAASECPGGRLHGWPEVGWVEVLAGDQPVAEGELGEFICTGLLNADLPLIRYRVGDSGRLAGGGGPCRCGRRLPSLSVSIGRIDDLLLTHDGRRVFFLNPIFYGIPVHEAQVIQETIDSIRVRYVPAQGFTVESSLSIAKRLRSRLGEVEVVLEEIDHIPRSPGGKGCVPPN